LTFINSRQNITSALINSREVTAHLQWHGVWRHLVAWMS